MNAKHNPFTSRLVLLLGLVFCTQQAFSQEMYDWEAWRQSRNIAGLSAQSSPRVTIAGKTAASAAELFGGYASGGFHGGSEARELWSAGARAETEVHLPSLLMTGDFSFIQQGGDNMCGSMFTQPGFFPVDVLEFTPGRKTLQTYGIGGGLAWRNDSPWILGGTFRFEGANYAKRKDLRHTTYRQDLEVVPSVLFDQSGWRIGASYIFRKTSEFIQAEQIGAATAESYYAFLDKGLMYGAFQVWDGAGIHLNEAGVDRFAVKEFTHGFALQGEIGNFLYADAEWRFSHGAVGEKGYTWFRFPGMAFSGQLIYTLHRPSGVHSFRLGYDWTRQDLDESVIEKVSSGGVTTPVEYDANRIYERRSLAVGPSWRYYRENGMELGAGFVVTNNRDRSTLMYPFLDNDESTVADFEADAVLPLGRFQLRAGVLFGCKIGEHSHVIDNDNEGLGVTTFPFRLQEWWDREQELSDATRLGGSLALRYGFSLAGVEVLFLEASCAVVHAFDIKLLPGANRQETLLTLGYDF